MQNQVDDQEAERQNQVSGTKKHVLQGRSQLNMNDQRVIRRSMWLAVFFSFVSEFVFLALDRIKGLVTSVSSCRSQRG